MSYQVLARKWRPQFFKDMVGQEHVLRALINALDNQRLHHAYLFTGTRGVGKTTIARILAKCLNCEQGISSEPCGTCNSCVEITEGRFVDLIEVDAASRTKVEDTREILDNVQYAPTRGRYKVYLIDEVHMLSNHSFNALLKTLEEPPPHVKFLLATTDPQKLPVTILSRCLQFSLKNMTPERIVNYLKTVLADEQVQYQEPALWLLGKAAEGSMRDALSLTDQAIAFGQGKVEEQDVASMLGTVDRGRVFQLAIALAERNAADVMAQVAQMSEHAVDFNNLLADLISLLHRIAIAQAVPDAVDNSQGDKEQIMALAQSVNPSDTQLYYQIAITGKRDLPLAPDPRSGLEMTLLRMLNFAPMTAKARNIAQTAPQSEPSAGAQGGSDSVKKSEASPPDLSHLKRQAQPSTSTPSANLPNDPAKAVSSATGVKQAEDAGHDTLQRNDVQPTSEAPKQAHNPSAHETVVHLNTEANQQAGASERTSSQAEPQQYQAPQVRAQERQNAGQSAEAPVNQPVRETPPWEDEPSGFEFAQQGGHDVVQVSAPSTPSDTTAVVTPEQTAAQAEPEEDLSELLSMPMTPASWPLIFNAVPLEGMLKNLVANTCLVQASADELLFHCDAGHIRLFGDAHQQRFQSTLNGALNKNFRLKVIEGAIHSETPAQRTHRLQHERQQQALSAIENDPNVQALKQVFNAQVIIESVQPIDS